MRHRIAAGIVRRPRSSFSEGSNAPLSPGSADCMQHIFAGASMVDEKIKIKCTKCSQVFRERAQRVRDGFQTNCHHCNRLITFDMSADDRNIRKALKSAKELRLVIEASRRAASIAQEGAPVPVRSQY
jgi:hypothetical protein